MDVEKCLSQLRAMTEPKPIEREYCQRKFGNTLITIDKNGHISIVGNWFSNHGCIYGHNIQLFKDGAINPITGFHVQVIGMDSHLPKTHLNWIYGKIRKGYFDHLIKGDFNGNS